jgi:hypothetical protein
MKTNLFTRITLAGVLLSAAVASGAAMAQGTEAPVAKPATHQVVQHRHAHKALHKTAHKVKHHKKSQVKSQPKAETPAPAPAATTVQAPAPTK